MVVVRRSLSIAACLSALVLTSPIQAQASATITIAAEVVQECTVQVRKALAIAAQRSGRPEILQKCSKGVSGQVDQQSVPSAQLQPQGPVTPTISKALLVRRSSSGTSNVVLVTATY